MKQYFDSNQEELLLKFLAKQEVSLSDNQLEKLFDYVQLVIQGNEQVNLISRNDIPKFLSRHIADSLMPYIVFSKKNFLKPNMSWADMGMFVGSVSTMFCTAGITKAWSEKYERTPGPDGILGNEDDLYTKKSSGYGYTKENSK